MYVDMQVQRNFTHTCVCVFIYCVTELSTNSVYTLTFRTFYYLSQLTLEKQPVQLQRKEN